MAEKIIGRDYLGDPDYFVNQVDDYTQRLKDLQSLGVNPQKILIGGCGFGADVFAAHQVWSQAQITALSVLDQPYPHVFDTLGSKLHFREQTILSFFQQADKDFELRGFDLIMFFNVLTDTFYQDYFYYLLPKVITSGGFVLEYPWASHSLNKLAMDPCFNPLKMPGSSASRPCYCWQLAF